MRILALDVGDRRIGLAVGDSLGMLATPLRVLQRVGVRKDVEAVLRTASEERAEALLVGIPLSLDGSVGPQAQRVERFQSALQEAASVPVLTWDERFTTTEADRLMLEAGLSPEKRKSMRDAAAAAVILQSYLDSRRTA